MHDKSNSLTKGHLTLLDFSEVDNFKHRSWKNSPESMTSSTFTDLRPACCENSSTSFAKCSALPKKFYPSQFNCLLTISIRNSHSTEIGRDNSKILAPHVPIFSMQCCNPLPKSISLINIPTTNIYILSMSPKCVCRFTTSML